MCRGTRGTLVIILKATATQRKQKLPRSLWFKPGSSVEFWQNVLNVVFKDDICKKNVRIGRTEFFNLADELKSFIALDIIPS